MEMNVSASNLNFSGKYKLNANQQMKTPEECLKRDFALGFWLGKSKDGEKIGKDLTDFYNGAYKQDKAQQINIILDIPDSEDKNFEESMSIVGQKFDKIG